MMIFSMVRFHPKTADKIIAGANMVIPADSPRWTKKITAVKRLVLLSNRPSKNS